MREYKSFIRYKKIGSGEYAYQISHYWDEKKKKIRQKSKYLGKVTEEGIKRGKRGSDREAFKSNRLWRCICSRGDVERDRIERNT